MYYNGPIHAITDEDLGGFQMVLFYIMLLEGSGTCFWCTNVPISVGHIPIKKGNFWVSAALADDASSSPKWLD